MLNAALRLWAYNNIGATMLGSRAGHADHTPDLGPLAIVWKGGPR